MNSDPRANPAPAEPSRSVTERVGRRAIRKLRSRRRGHRPVWYALGMYGLVGWSVAIPAVAGAALGIWLDRGRGHGRISWTLTLLFAGLAVGCLNAWLWVKRESEENHNENGKASTDDQ